MKKGGVMNKIQLYFFIAMSFLLACSAEKKQFNVAKETNTIEGYERYLSKYENGKYSKSAHERIEEKKFSQLRNTQFSSFIKILKTNLVDNRSTVSIKPGNRILMGTPLSIRLQHLPRKKSITLNAYRRDWDRLLYSFATYQSDENGQIALEKTESVSGTYAGIDALGIFWSMSNPVLENGELPFHIKELKQNTIYFAVECNHRIIATEQLELTEKSPQIISEKINNDTLTAVFHYPKNAKNLPAVILLSGSEGGYDNVDKMAQILSSHGYAVLALAYFKIKPLPRYLEKIPIEYLFHAIDWVKGRPHIDSSRVILAGGSRGGELALLLASLRSDIKGVIAIEPSYVLWQGLPHSPGSLFFPKPAWTLNGRALPFLKHRLHLPTMARLGSGGVQIELMKVYEGIVDNQKKIEPALIKVENIRGPILLVAGKDGRVWPAYRMCRMMEDRLGSLNFPHPVKCLYYENAGHYVTITPMLYPTIQYKYDQLKVGGTDSGNASAQIDSWNKIIEFLKTHFPS